MDTLTLKVGDEVGVCRFSWHRNSYSTKKIVKITPTGRVSLENHETVFNRQGDGIGSKNESLLPLQETLDLLKAQQKQRDDNVTVTNLLHEISQHKNGCGNYFFNEQEMIAIQELAKLIDTKKKM